MMGKRFHETHDAYLMLKMTQSYLFINCDLSNKIKNISSTKINFAVLIHYFDNCRRAINININININFKASFNVN